MDLGIDGIRENARELAEDRMEDQCKISRASTEPGVRDSVTGTIVYPEPIVIYGPDTEPHQGKCRIRMANAAGAALVDAGAVTVMQQTQISVPVDTVLQRGDRIEVIRSDNPLAQGRTFTVRALPTGSQQSANRYGIELVT